MDGDASQGRRDYWSSQTWTQIFNMNGHSQNKISHGYSFKCNLNIHVKVGVLFMNWGVEELWGWDVWQILAPPQKLPPLLTTLEEQANMTVAKHFIKSISPEVTFKTSCSFPHKSYFGFTVFASFLYFKLLDGWVSRGYLICSFGIFVIEEPRMEGIGMLIPRPAWSDPAFWFFLYLCIFVIERPRVGRTEGFNIEPNMIQSGIFIFFLFSFL